MKIRHRQKLKRRAARWKAWKSDTYEAALSRRPLFGYDIMRGDSSAQPKVILKKYRSDTSQER